MKVGKLYFILFIAIYLLLGIFNLLSFSFSLGTGASFAAQLKEGIYILVINNAWNKLLAAGLYSFLICLGYLFINMLRYQKPSQ